MNTKGIALSLKFSTERESIFLACGSLKLFMNQENNSASNLNQLLTNLRFYNASIGDYEQHTMLEDAYTYSVKLSNGTIRIYIEEIQDKTIIPRERMQEIAMRFNERK